MASYNGNPTAGDREHLILIVDDEEINREMLRLNLVSEYDVLTAGDGESALSLIREHSSRLSLILLDLIMPGMHGLDVLRTVRAEPAMRHIPVIVVTSDREAEVESLHAGAADFLSKPYPEREIILARIRRTIELTEDREKIESTERDRLTGLLNRDYFYLYAERYDQFHASVPMDALLLDICHFRLINERYGRAFGNEVLRALAGCLRDQLRQSGGIVCRQSGDIFLVYRPHREDYASLLEAAVRSLPTRSGGSRFRLRMGVYPEVDRSIDMERRFDRAKMAADTLLGDYRSAFALYDSALHEDAVFAERLLEDFDDAIRDRQFRVCYQPKFDIRSDRPVLAGAEALVRWNHPELGCISPGRFIPLFEKNGLIRRLDEYVWRETAARIRDWKDRLGVSVPVSVNVSRVDLFDSELIGVLEGLARASGLRPEELHLEITESAYTGDAEQIVDKVRRLRELGFRIEMEDFGTGYSSLNMIADLPIDALKLDMLFIRKAFADGGDLGMIRIVIGIAKYLSVPVIAEGVETEAQLGALRELGCELVQGFYFSRPVPAEEFEAFLTEKKRLSGEAENR